MEDSIECGWDRDDGSRGDKNHRVNTTRGRTDRRGYISVCGLSHLAVPIEIIRPSRRRHEHERDDTIEEQNECNHQAGQFCSAAIGIEAVSGAHDCDEAGRMSERLSGRGSGIRSRSRAYSVNDQMP